jgi:hypothetical protein
VLSIESNKKVVYATKIEFFDYKLPIATVPNDAIFISKKELDILEAKIWSQNRMLMAGAKIESHTYKK